MQYSQKDSNNITAFIDLKQELFAIANDQLNIAEISPKRRFFDQGAAVISTLLEKGSISKMSILI